MEERGRGYSIVRSVELELSMQKALPIETINQERKSTSAVAYLSLGLVTAGGSRYDDSNNNIVYHARRERTTT